MCFSHTSTNTTFFPKPPTTFLRGERRKYAEKKVCLNRVSNSQPAGHESDRLTTEPPRRALKDRKLFVVNSAPFSTVFQLNYLTRLTNTLVGFVGVSLALIRSIDLISSIEKAHKVQKLTTNRTSNDCETQMPPKNVILIFYL